MCKRGGKRGRNKPEASLFSRINIEYKESERLPQPSKMVDAQALEKTHVSMYLFSYASTVQ